MAAPDPHEREVQAILRQIRAFQSRAARRWRLDIPLWRLAGEGLGIFVLGVLVGLGLCTLFEVLKDALAG
jgi:hypothetical protein